MFLTINNKVMGVSRCQTLPHIRHCYITSTDDEPYAHVDERLPVISSEAGNHAMQQSKSISKTNELQKF